VQELVEKALREELLERRRRDGTAPDPQDDADE
jgi:hypothetical protein